MTSFTERERLLEAAARLRASPAFAAVKEKQNRAMRAKIDERERLVDALDREKAASIRSSLQKVEREAARGPIDRKLRAFYHNLLTILGEYESKIEERRKLDDGF